MADDDDECCPVCQCSFAALDAEAPSQRAAHANACADDGEKDPMLRLRYACPVCLADLSPAVLGKRVEHVKACAKVAGIKRPRQLRTRLKPNPNLVDELLQAHYRQGARARCQH